MNDRRKQPRNTPDRRVDSNTRNLIDQINLRVAELKAMEPWTQSDYFDQLKRAPYCTDRGHPGCPDCESVTDKIDDIAA